MRSLRVHLVWAATAVVLAAALAQLLSARRDETRRETETALRPCPFPPAQVGSRK